MQQLDLFSWTPPARYPHIPAARRKDTSESAAESMKKSAAYIRTKVMTAITACGAAGATSSELADALGIACESVQPRTSELKKQGKITDSGQRRASRAEGKKAIVWKAL